jgi:hypothetical protein
MKHVFFILFFCSFIFNNLKSQNIYEFGFEQDFSVHVTNQNNDTLHYAWWGGLNAVQFAEMDINLDGVIDLIVFDRHGNKILPLINNNVAGQFSYTYSPQYKKNFPKEISDWIITYDFNNDGKNDIFSYSPGGIKVYKNISTSTELKFELWSYLLNSLIYSNYINIYLTDVDYPIITDVDGDGDVDIVTFYILGNFVELHKNMGVELHGNPDTMNFHRDYRCWGNFMESELSNDLSLNITCPWSKYLPNEETDSNKQILHVGSAMLFMDTNGDGLKDLLIADTDYPNLIRLINGGTPDSAHFVSQEQNFPSNTKSVELFSIPVPAFIDINNDGKKEFLVSAFDPSPIINETKKSVWLYTNHGTNDSLDLEFIQDNFIQDLMIEHGSGAYPVMQDWNGNGLADLFVANYGTRDSSWYDSGFLYTSYTSTIALYENVGTSTSPAFHLITEDFANLSSLGKLALYPAFADLDGDGDVDMVVGNRDGNLLYFQNTAGAGNPMNMVLIDSMWQNIDVGLFSTPVFFDLTKNGLPDLVVGQRMGYLSFWENTGTASNPIFIHQTDTFGQVYTADLTHSYFGHSVPAFYRNSSGKTFLFTGSARGWILHFDDIDNNLNGNFNLIDTVFVADGNDKIFVYEGMRVSPFVYDIDNDLYPELLVGNYSGGISYFKGIQPPPDTVGVKPYTQASELFKVFPNPFTNEITIEATTPLNECKVEFISSDGRLLASQTYYKTKSFQLYPPQTSPGIYLLKITYYQQDTIPKMHIVKLIRQ